MGRGTSQGRRRPFSHGGPAIIVAIDDDTFDQARPMIEKIVAANMPGVPIEYVRTSEIGDPNYEADLWFGAPPPKRPGFTLICKTYLGQVFEQEDATGAIYRDRTLVWPEAPIGMATPALKIIGRLEPLHDGALLFRTGERERVTGIPTIFNLFSQPKTRPGWQATDRVLFLARAAAALGPEMH